MKCGVGKRLWQQKIFNLIAAVIARDLPKALPLYLEVFIALHSLPTLDFVSNCHLSDASSVLRT